MTMLSPQFVPDLWELAVVALGTSQIVPRLFRKYSTPRVFRAWTTGSLVTSFVCVGLSLLMGYPPDPLPFLYAIPATLWMLWIPGGIIGMIVGSLYRLVRGPSGLRLVGCAAHTGGVLLPELPAARRKRYDVAKRPNMYNTFFYVFGLPSALLGATTFLAVASVMAAFLTSNMGLFK